MLDLPVPHPESSTLVVPAPGDGPGFWAGAPSAVPEPDGGLWLAYRLRRPVGRGRGYANVIAWSADGESAETVLVLEADAFGAASLERPALVRRPDRGWRLYVSCATPGSLHWKVVAIDADHPSQFRPDDRRTVFAGDERTAYKDPVVHAGPDGWQAWVCVHEIGDPQRADAMYTRHATSPDGIDWTVGPKALAPRAGRWDARGVRIASVVGNDGRWQAYYDGRATADQNWEEWTGIASGPGPDALAAAGIDGHRPCRYVEVVPLRDGGLRLYYEAARADGAHDLRTEYVSPRR